MPSPELEKLTAILSKLEEIHITGKSMKATLEEMCDYIKGRKAREY